MKTIPKNESRVLAGMFQNVRNLTKYYLNKLKDIDSPIAYLRALDPKSRYMIVGGEPGRLLQLLGMNPWISLFTGKKVHIVALKPNKDLQYINELCESGRLKCIIDGPYPFEETPRMIVYFGMGKHIGKVVVRIT